MRGSCRWCGAVVSSVNVAGAALDWTKARAEHRSECEWIATHGGTLVATLFLVAVGRNAPGALHLQPLTSHTIHAAVVEATLLYMSPDVAMQITDKSGTVLASKEPKLNARWSYTEKTEPGL